MTTAGSFERSDLTKQWARRRAWVWILVCVSFVVLLLVGAVIEASWSSFLLSGFFAIIGSMTALRLHRHTAPEG